MVSVKEVSPGKLISEVTAHLKQDNSIQQPEWARFVKTGPHKERKPQSPDWWYIRCASILRKTYLFPNLGVGKLRMLYGGRKHRGVQPESHLRASGKIIRTMLQQLEVAGYIKKQQKGRILTPKGRSLIDKITLKLRGERPARRTPESEPVPATEKSTGGAKKTRATKRTTPKNPKPRSKAETNAPKPSESGASSKS